LFIRGLFHITRILFIFIHCFIILFFYLSGIRLWSGVLIRYATGDTFTPVCLSYYVLHLLPFHRLVTILRDKNPLSYTRIPHNAIVSLREYFIPPCKLSLACTKNPVNCLESPKHAHYIRYTFNTLVDCFDL